MKYYFESFKKLEIHQIQHRNLLFDWALQETLHESLEKEGLLNPLCVYPQDDKNYMIVDGFQRFRWLFQKDVSPLPCLIFKPSLSMKELMLWKLKSHSLVECSFLEVFRILDLLAQYGASQESIVAILPCFGFPASLQRLQQIKRLQKQMQEQQECFKMYSLSDLLALLPLKAEDIRAVGKVFANFMIGGNKFKSTIKLLSETAKLMQCSPYEILEQTEVQRIMANTQLDSSLKFKHFKLFLEKHRYPEKTKTQQQFQVHLRKLQLPSNAKLDYDPSFEKEAVTLTIEIESLQELTQTLQAVSAESENWEALFQLTHGQTLKTS